MNHQRFLFATVTAVSLGSISIGPLAAQPYPNRTVTIVNPLPAGGATDVICRIIAAKLQAMFGQSFIIENRTGAAGSIAVESVARAACDTAPVW